MWMIRGVRHEIGDSVFVVRGLLPTKVERFTIVRPRKLNGGWPVGSGFDGFAWASNGSETIRINRRGKIVDQLFSSRRIVAFEVGHRLEQVQNKERASRAPQIDADLQARLDECFATPPKVRLLLGAGWLEADVAVHLGIRPQMVREISLTLP